MHVDEQATGRGRYHAGMELGEDEVRALKRLFGYFCSKETFEANVDVAVETAVEDPGHWERARNLLAALCPDD